MRSDLDALTERIHQLADAVTQGDLRLAAARTLVCDARDGGSALHERAACTLAMICIQDARETCAGLDDLQRRVLARVEDDPPELARDTGHPSHDECIAWALLGSVIATLFSAATTTSVGITEAGEATLRALAKLEGSPPRVRLTFARYLLGVAALGSSDSLLGRLDAVAAAAIKDATSIDRVACDEWYAERAMVAAFMFNTRRIDEDTLVQHIKRGASVGAHQAFKIARAELMRAVQIEGTDRQRAALDALRSALQPQQVVPWIAFLRMKAEFLIRCVDYSGAEAAAAEALQVAERVSAHAPLLVACLVSLGNTQALQGRLVDAVSNYDRAAARALPGHAVLIGAWRDVLRGVAEIDRDGAAALNFIKGGLAALRGAAAFSFLTVAPALAARICALSLDFDIEVDYVRTVISRSKLVAPFAHARAWPWALRIHLFGGFRCDWSLDADGEGKARNKPAKRLLGLLKWLAHVGPEGIDRRTLIRRLWPGEAVEGQSAAFDMALARLRKALPDADLIIVDKGMLRLDRTRVWVDTWAFTSLCDHVGEHLASDSLPKPDVLLHWAAEANRLMLGRYLDGEEDGATMEVVAEQLRERFVNNQAQLAEALARYDVAAARDLLAKALEREPYAEQLYRALMRLQLRAGDFAEVVRTYRRCQTAISRAYGVAPASQTQAIRAQLPKPVQAV